GSTTGARLFHRTFGFKPGGSAIFRIGASAILGGAPFARRRAGFGIGGAILRGNGFRSAIGGADVGCGRGSGFGNATIVGCFGGSGSNASGSGSGSTFFALREAARVTVK